LESIKTPFQHLDFSNICADKPGTGMQALFESLSRNKAAFSGLQILNLNNMKLTDTIDSLVLYLSSQDSLEDFSLCGSLVSKTALNSVMESFVGHSKNLRILDISSNKYNKIEDWEALIQWLRNDDYHSLKTLNISSTSVPPEVVTSILAAIHKDVSLELNISKNNLGFKGAQMIAPLLSNSSICSLDISETNLGDDGLHLICESLFNNDSVTHLDISNNFSLKNTKTRNDLIESMIQMTLSNTLPLEVLRMSGTTTKNRLRELICPFLLNLRSNNKLRELDISGQGFGNTGAVSLSKILPVNHSLTKLSWDENSVGLLGYWNFKHSLKNNTTLREVAVPYQDILQVYSDPKTDKVVFSKILSKIEIGLSKNHR